MFTENAFICDLSAFRTRGSNLYQRGEDNRYTGKNGKNKEKQKFFQKKSRKRLFVQIMFVILLRRIKLNRL